MTSASLAVRQAGDFAQQNLGTGSDVSANGIAMNIGEWTLINRPVSAAERTGYMNDLFYRYPPTIS